MPAARGVAQELATDGVATVHIVRHRHVVAGFQPAVAVAVEQDFAGFPGAVMAACAPETAVEDDRIAWCNLYRCGAFRIGFPIFG